MLDPIPSAPDLQALDQTSRRLIAVVGGLLYMLVDKDLLSPREARQMLEASLGPMHDTGSYPDRMIQPLFEMLRRKDPDGDY